MVLSKKPLTTLVFLVIFLTEATLHHVCFGGDSKNNDTLCLENEKQALLNFKRDLVDPNGRLLSWVAEEDCCKWSLVVCDNITGHVKKLHLANTFEDYRPLTGKINPSLLNLKHLSHLDLSRNEFEGIPIPSFIGSLVSLRYLNLTYAGFEGLIPHQLGNLSSLRHLVLGGSFYYQLYANNLDWLSHLTSLKYLELSLVDLSDASNNLFQPISKLPSLSELHLSSCELDHIHHDLPYANFTSLAILDISSNSFTSLPSWLFSLDNLVYLDLSYNSLELGISTLCGFQNMSLKHLDLTQVYFEKHSLPSCLYNFSRLEHLSLGSNNLEGSISSSIEDMTSIISLDVSNNYLEGKIPASFGKLCNLENINFANNNHIGKISEAFESLSGGCLSNRLKSLNLEHNSFTGRLSMDQIGEFRNLVDLSLGSNKISGSIPASIGTLSALEVLDLSANNLIGALPESLGLLSNLRLLDISSNQLGGIVTEAHFAYLTNLRTLYASETPLTLSVSPDWIPPFHLEGLKLKSWNLGDQFPKWLKSQKDYTYLDLSNTSISDAIPSWFWNLSTHFSLMDLSNNQIRGEVPRLFFVRSHSSKIYLNSNKFTGPLPQISSGVAVLDLSGNLFTGEISHLLCQPASAGTNQLLFLGLGENLLSGMIPDCWMKWPLLHVIELSNNKLTGEIPSSIGSLQSLWSLHLRNNSLYGQVPFSLQNCKDLFILNLGLNKLVGSIPSRLGSDLLILNVRSNNLNGHIPLDLCDLTRLQILDVAENNFSGTIPRCFDNLKAMATKRGLDTPFVDLAYGSNKPHRESIIVATKGREDEYKYNLKLVTALDLSANNLYGDIPTQLTSLQGLWSLNLSRNHFKGSIPDKIGSMNQLETLDLSRNQLSGKIPPSMSNLNFLSHLDLSYNNLSGEIPLSTQLQSMHAASFIGNQLCGPPFTISCRTTDQNKTSTGTKQTSFIIFLFKNIKIS